MHASSGCKAFKIRKIIFNKFLSIVYDIRTDKNVLGCVGIFTT